ncbi:septum site-determining protein MinC [uncultured Shewanella sp.]|uniref:septum site-determining protein MinC n=1 Tax=uncultured Shewanella sp. TaxID=173975 RepID=UPI00261352A3|nr:septum site-determining protein MinC [uncultured Shewanella sp.]
MYTPSLELKGASFTLSVLHIKHQDMSRLTAELDNKLAIAPQFFIGAPLVINIERIKDPLFDLARLKHILTQRHLIIVGITAAIPELIEQAKSLGLAIVKSGKQSLNPPQLPKTTKIIQRNIRSGQQIYTKGGDLIIIGAVGNGAEVIADGSIHVYGTLRGKAMAGAAGDKHAVIIAKKIEAELVSIAGQYWLTENLQQNITSQSACIRLKENTLTADNLSL